MVETKVIDYHPYERTVVFQTQNGPTHRSHHVMDRFVDDMPTPKEVVDHWLKKISRGA